MTINVLVVDDSLFFRRRLTDFLEQSPQIKVIGQANNGEDAISQVRSLKPDVVTMDIEMPVMDGITAVKRIMEQNPLPILMFSSLTKEGAEATLSALEAGAADFLPKNFDEIANSHSGAISSLQQKVLSLAKSRLMRPSRRAFELKRQTPLESSNRSVAQVKPSARAVHKAIINCWRLVRLPEDRLLYKVLTQLPTDFQYPILLVQHMPAAFTTAYAERLNSVCNISVSEAVDGELLKPGHAYLAPGGRQMLLEGNRGRTAIRITDVKGSDDRVTYKPSVDITFASASKVFQGVMALF